jgi:protein involved in polysaccharide export with SLBB domain
MRASAATRKVRAGASRCLTLCLLAVGASTALAQGAPLGDAGRPNASRDELTTQAAQAELAASASGSAEAREMKQREAAAIRWRLSHGDFEVGDRIVLVVPGDSVLIDTLTVAAGRTVNFPKLPPITLDTILRSELHAHLAQNVGRFLKDTLFQATPLIRFGVLGEVARPGYYHLSTDASISDALMAAGGPTSHADLPRSIVRRGSRDVMSKRAVRDAMAAGLTLDQVGLAAGDELVVAETRGRRDSWTVAAQIAAVATGVLIGLNSLHHR